MLIHFKTTKYFLEGNNFDNSSQAKNVLDGRIFDREKINGKIKTYASVIYFLLLTTAIIITIL